MVRGDIERISLEADPNIWYYVKKFKISYLVYAIIVAVLANLIVGPLFNDNGVECDLPYVEISGLCCLDQDENGLCDTDEIIKEIIIEEKENRTVLPWIVRLTIPQDTSIVEEGEKKLAFRVGNDGSAREDFFVISVVQEPVNPSLKLVLSGGGFEIIERGKEHFIVGNLKAEMDIKPGRVRYIITVRDSDEKVYATDSFWINVINPDYGEDF